MLGLLRTLLPLRVNAANWVTFLLGDPRSQYYWTQWFSQVVHKLCVNHNTILTARANPTITLSFTLLLLFTFPCWLLWAWSYW
jgi:hypothetical protein